MVRLTGAGFVDQCGAVDFSLRPPRLAGGISGATRTIRRQSDQMRNEGRDVQRQCDVPAFRSADFRANWTPKEITTDAFDLTSFGIGSHISGSPAHVGCITERPSIPCPKINSRICLSASISFRAADVDRNETQPNRISDARPSRNG